MLLNKAVIARGSEKGDSGLRVNNNRGIERNIHLRPLEVVIGRERYIKQAMEEVLKPTSLPCTGIIPP